MPFLLAKILNFQGTVHLIGVGSLSKLKVVCDYSADVGSPQNKSMPEMYFSSDDWYYAKKES